MNADTMSLETIDIHPATAPRATLIVLHGLGADGTDFLPMCDAFNLAAVGPVRYVMPRAPVRPVTINGGQPMRAWYDILGTDLQRREDEAGLRTSVAQVHALLDQEIARGVPAHRIALAGFSQGCAITLMAGLRYPPAWPGWRGCRATCRWPPARRPSAARPCRARPSFWAMAATTAW